MGAFVFYGLTIISLIITFGAQGYISKSYSKYSKEKTTGGMKGCEVARRLLDKHGLNDIKVQKVSGYLTDHYDPKGRCVRLSEHNYENASIAAVSVACHECGHAIQDKKGFVFLRIRSSMVPFVNFCSYAGYIAIIIGSVMSALGLIWAGIIAEMVILLFQLVTLPVEFDASKRGLKEVKEEKILDEKELKGGKVVLRSAALTYVASVSSTIIQVLRLILIYGNRKD